MYEISIQFCTNKTMLWILLLTGFCITSASPTNGYHFINERMTWDDAQYYCFSKYTDIAAVRNKNNQKAMMNTPTHGYEGKAWIGLYENMTNWVWVDGQTATYSAWKPGQPNNQRAKEFCVYVTVEESWDDHSCMRKKAAVCSGGSNRPYIFVENQMTWAEAKAACESTEGHLATALNVKAYSSLLETLNGTEAWIGLSRPNVWYWIDTGEPYTFKNWQTDQPDNLNGDESCAATEVGHGTWTDERCNATYPFFCYGAAKSASQQSRKTVMKIKIQSGANMENQACNARLLQQIEEAFVREGMTDFKVRWKKLPVRQKNTQERSDVC